jgi:hypothetical protein
MHINKGLPALPKIAICYDTDGVSELRLDSGWG